MPRAHAGVRTIRHTVGAIAATAIVLIAGWGTPASANTPSDYSKTIYVGSTPGHAGLPLTVGWTKDHAWVIASYAAALAGGAGLIASEVCSIAGGETGPLNPVGRVCSETVQDIVAALTAGSARLTNHGLWLAFYVWNSRTSTSGTW